MGRVITGVVIGVTATVFLLRRHRKHGPAQIIESRPGGGSSDSWAFTTTTVQPVAAVSGLDQFLLPPKSDKELAGEMQSLGYLIQQHVEDNYHLSLVRQSGESLRQVLEDLGLGDGDITVPKPGQPPAMAMDPGTRFAAL